MFEIKNNDLPLLIAQLKFYYIYINIYIYIYVLHIYYDALFVLVYPLISLNKKFLL